MVYYGLSPSHHCQLPENSTWTVNESVPMIIKKGRPLLSSCTMYKDPGNHSLGTMNCNDGWNYTSPKERSIVGEWGYVCGEKWKVSLATSIYFLGVMFGGLIGGLVSDKFGRRPVILVTIYVQAVLGTAVAFTPNYETFVVLRFLQALLIQSLQTCSFTLTMELFKPRMRAIVGTIASLAWTLAVMTLALAASQIQSWRTLQLVVTLPSIISFFYFWFIPESLRWLLSKQKIDKAEEMAKKILKFNNIDKPNVKSEIESICKECLEGNENSQQSSIIDLVRTPILRRRTLVLSFLWFTASLITYGVSYALPTLGPNIYASFAISGSLDIIIRLLVIPALTRFGRKKPAMVCFFGSGVCCLAVPLVLVMGQENYASEIASMVFAVIGKGLMSACFAIVPIYTTELYPTVIRSLGQGLAVFSSRIGGILAPQLSFVGELAWKPFPFVTCGIVGIIAASLAYFLPETQGQPMPDMIEDVEHPVRGKSVIVMEEKDDTNVLFESKEPEKFPETVPETETVFMMPESDTVQNNNQKINGLSNRFLTTGNEDVIDDEEDAMKLSEVDVLERLTKDDDTENNYVKTISMNNSIKRDNLQDVEIANL